MTKLKTKIMILLLSMAMILHLVPIVSFAEETHAGQVHVVVKNETYQAAQGAPWDGTSVDCWIPIDSSSTALSVLSQALGNDAGKLDVQSGFYGSYINGILGLSGGMGGQMSGWMFAVNDAMASSSIDSYSVSAGSLNEEDLLSFEYSCDGGADIGADWTNHSKALKSLEVSQGILSPSFSSNLTSYTLTISEEPALVTFTPRAENRNMSVSIFSGNTEYKRSSSIPVSDGTIIEIRCSDGADTVIYTIQGKKAGQAVPSSLYTDTMKILDQGLTGQACVYGNEWAIISMARAGLLSSEKAQAYYDSVEEAVKSLGSSQLSRYATDNSRVILALSSIGVNPADVGGYNLLEPLADMNFLGKQGINAYIYALLAFDSRQYTIPDAPEGTPQTTREGLIQAVLDGTLSGGGWDWMGSSASSPDPDLTSVALQALAPYYINHSAVKEAADNALAALSALQNPDGSFSSWGTANACSTAQVLTALTSLNLNPLQDGRFLKNGFSVLQALQNYYIPGQGFQFELGSQTVDFPFSTVQASYALVSYERLIKGQNTLYDMRDASSLLVTEPEENSPEAGGDSSLDTTPATGDGNTSLLWIVFLFISLVFLSGLLHKKALSNK